MGKRPYRMSKRAEALAETRERIIRATMALHDEKGVATTTFTDIAERAGVGPATVYRNFPTQGELVAACGAHVWRDMRPPTAEDAHALFAGLLTPAERRSRLVKELDAFYRRGEHRLQRAAQDRERVPGLDAFLGAVEAGIESWVRAAHPGETPEATIQTVLALTDFRVWLSLRRLRLAKPELQALMLRLIACGLSGEDSREAQSSNVSPG